MHHRPTLGLAHPLVVGVLVLLTILISAGAAGAAERPERPPWPMAADIIAPGVTVELSGDGVTDVWFHETRPLAEDPRDTLDVLRRCRAAGYSVDECRRAIHDDDDHDLATRCRAAGLTPTECRRAIHDDDHDLATRCRAAGLTPTECRRAIHDDDLAEDAVRSGPVTTVPADIIEPGTPRPVEVRPVPTDPSTTEVGAIGKAGDLMVD